MNKKSLNYQDAGVNISKGNQFIEKIKPLAAKTKRPEVLAGLGGFGALFKLSNKAYKQPILVSSTDGVGTKLKLAVALKKHDTIGIDLVAMCVNDIIVQGAEPLFFLDYFATGHLELKIATEVIRGIATGCEQAGTALIGGETAEMPGIYTGEDYDMAGFAVGIVEKSKLIDGKKVKPGDVLIGLASSGAHSNGFSLVRKIIQTNESDLSKPFGTSTLGHTLLTPTRIYVKPLLALIKKIKVHALAHVTGGGLLENLPRVMPAKTQAIINSNSWQRPEIFNWIQQHGNISEQEMYRTFNCGIGMVICVAPNDVAETLKILKRKGETAMIIGDIATAKTAKPQVTIRS